MNLVSSSPLFRRTVAVTGALAAVAAVSGCQRSTPADVATTGATEPAASAPKTIDPKINAQIQQGIQAGIAQGRAEAEAHRAQATTSQNPTH